MTEHLSMDEAFIERLTDIVLTNLRNENFSAGNLAREAGMSRMTLHRKLKSIKNQDVTQFIKEIRLTCARELLEQNAGTASEIGFMVGFGSSAYFTKCFHDFYGYPPGKVKQFGAESQEQSNLDQANSKLGQKEPTNRIFIPPGSRILLLLAIIVLAIILVYPKIFKRNALEKLRSSDEPISVAVMPFMNLTNDTIFKTWPQSIQYMLITYLTNFTGELKIRQIESVNNLILRNGIDNYASLTSSLATKISKNLNVSMFIYGSIIKSGTKIRLNAQLFYTRTGESIKSFEIEGPAKDEMIFPLVDTIKQKLTNYLLLSEHKKKYPLYDKYITTRSPEAYRYFVYGQDAFAKGDYSSAIDLFSAAISIDSNFFDAAEQIGWAYGNQGKYLQAKECAIKAYKKKDLMPLQQRTSTCWLYAAFFEGPYEEIKYVKQLRDIDDQSPDTYYLLGNLYINLHLYDRAIQELKKSLEIYKKMGSKPFWINDYLELGISYHNTQQYRKENQNYKKAEKDFPDDPGLLQRQAILALTEGDKVAAEVYIRKYISIRKETGTSETIMTTSLASIYSEAGLLERAEEYYRLALSLEPVSEVCLNNLAYFLIDKERNINEGLGLANKALELNPCNYSILESKGWGLYKQGKYKPALEILERSWDIRMKNAIYDHSAFLHLNEAKKAVAINQ